jgi:arylsulfatase A-like enzyme
MRRPLLALAAAALGLIACGGPDAPRSLLLITVDTLRADALGAYGARGGLTPRLDALAKEGVVFQAAYAPAPFTFPSIASILTGHYPSALGIRTNASRLADDVPTLASALHARGWRTGAAVGSYVLRAKSGLARDFDVYDDALPQVEVTRDSPERIAPDTTKAALAVAEQLRAGDADDAQRYLLWVHYQDPHGPYTPPPELAARARALEPDAGTLPVLESNHGGAGIPAYQVLGERREIADYRAAYRGEVAYMDAEVGRLLDGLRERGLLEDALVVFTADHGEAMGEHGVWFAHGHDLTDDLVRVPLLVSGPGVAPSRRTDVVSLVDLVPSLLRALGAEAPAGLPGRDVLAPDAPMKDSVPLLDTLAYGAKRSTGVVERGYKLILRFEDGAWRARLYRRGREQVDIAAPAPQLAAQLRESLLARQERGLRDARSETPQQLDARERAALEALGYTAGAGK